MRRKLVAALALTTLVTSACTTSHVDNPTVTTPPSISPTATAGASTASLPDPCKLLEPAALQVSFGGVVSPGATPPGAVRKECDWTVTGSQFGTDGTVTLYYPAVQSSAAFAAAEAGLPGAMKLEGLGNPAFYDSTMTALTMLVGEHQFVLQGDFHLGNDAGKGITLESGLMGLASVAANLI